MPLSSAKPLQQSPALTATSAHFRVAEQIVLLFFFYTAVLALIWAQTLDRKFAGLLVAALVFALLRLIMRQERGALAVLRNTLIPGAVLAGYWQMGWFNGHKLLSLQSLWLHWDQWLLEQVGLRSAIEMLGPSLPWCLELAYLCLYSIPLLCIACLYYQGEVARMPLFLATFAAGTLAVYALLPFWPVDSPRIAFPGQNLPQFHSAFRDINLSMLNHLDIQTSVFPSGHVAVAFSCALGMRRALPTRWPLWCPFFGFAGTVYLATIYGRYHYAADGAASIAVSLLVSQLLGMYERLR